jgi:hypothetical protein
MEQLALNCDLYGVDRPAEPHTGARDAK